MHSSHLEAFHQRVLDVHGDRGRAWLAALPSTIRSFEQRWSISVGETFAPLSYNWVAPAGPDLVLKLGLPDPELASEITALSAWQGRGSARLVAADSARGALLLERVVPGTRLPDDANAAVAALAVMAELHAASPPTGLRSLRDWTDGIERARNADFAPALVERAARVRDELLASALPAVLLHGDLHHENVLAATRSPCLAIDPKGVIGDPAYECATFILNTELIMDAIDRFADRFDRPRVIGWAFVHAVLSAWWTYEDHGTHDEPTLALAESLKALR